MIGNVLAIKPQITPDDKNPNMFSCQLCDFISSNKKDFKKHIHTQKHKAMIWQSNQGEKTQITQDHEISKIYHCVFCDFLTVNKKDYKKHLLTQKHSIYEKKQKTLENPTALNHTCHCGKIYKDYSGLWKHNKKCTVPKTDTPLTTAQLFTLYSQTIKEIVVEQANALCKSLTSNNNNTATLTNNTHNNTNNLDNNNNNSLTNNHCHNKTFNLQFFLNDTCKDAINMSDFIDSIQLQVNDFEEVGEKGFVNGISNIIINNLKAIDEHMRPVHCSDLKRESVYIKNNNQWTKDTNNNEGLRKVVKAVAYKNTRLSPAFKAKYPDYALSSSKSSDRYNKAMVESHGGTGDNEEANVDKIMKRITKEILITKK